VAIALAAPELGIAGMLHYLMPDSHALDKAMRTHLELFADTGMEILMLRLHGMGAHREHLVAHVAGGGDLIYRRQQSSPLALGQRNVDAAHRLLGEAGIEIASERVGGCRARLVTVAPGSGTVHIAETPTGGGER
jgi:chemotaxis protein CheD